MKTDKIKSSCPALWLVASSAVTVLVLLVCFMPVLTQADGTGPMGMVADSSGKVHVFDAGTNTVIGTVTLPVEGDFVVGDCAITPDGSLGLVADYCYNLWVIDLLQSPPALAAGTNPVLISNPGEDLAITPDGKYAIAADGSGGDSIPISLINIAARQEVDTLSLADNHNSVDVLNDGSILVTSWDSSSLYRLILPGGFVLIPTGEKLAVDYPVNVVGSPTSGSGFITGYYDIVSFLVPGLQEVDTRTLPGEGICGVMHPEGNKIYVRTCDYEGTNSFVVAYSFNSATGELGIDPLFTIPVTQCIAYFGIDQMAITPDGTRLYVSEAGLLNVYDADTGEQLDSISAKVFDSLTGVCFQPEMVPERIPVKAVGGELRDCGKSSLTAGLVIIPVACLVWAILAVKLAGRKTGV